MVDLFKSEIIRFRAWSIAFGCVHLAVLGFLTRLIDLAQQPLPVYTIFGAVYLMAGLLLGLYQIGTYRRPNPWLYLLHRPVAHWRIAAALTGASTALLAAAVLLPLAIVATWQKVMTARVLDHRHLLLILSALLIGLCGYLAGGCALLLNRRYSVSALVPLLLLVFGHASGLGAIALQLIIVGWLALLMFFAFKPELMELPRGTSGVVITAAPMMIAMWFALVLLGFAGELVWIMQGSHPNNLPRPLPGSTKEADMAKGKDLMILGLAGSHDPEASLWREQAAISEVFTMAPGITVPNRNGLTNVAAMEFDDDTRRIRWVFSHDDMRFHGYDQTNFRAAGVLGVDGNAAFPAPALPGPKGLLLAGGSIYQYDEDSGHVLLRAQLPAHEVVTGLEVIGERVALLSNRALYVYDGREWNAGDGLLVPRQRVAIPGTIGSLRRVDMMELLDGYLLSFTFTIGSHNGNSNPYQEVLRVDEKGKVTRVSRRALTHPGGVVYLYDAWYPSPVLFAVQRSATELFAGYSAQRDFVRPPVPGSAKVIAGILMLLSAVGAAWRARRRDLPLVSRVAWIVACGVLSVPALLSFLLMVPSNEEALVVVGRQVPLPAGSVHRRGACAPTGG